MRGGFSSARPYLAGFVLVFLFQTAFFIRGKTGNGRVQPIAFNHAKHLASGLECTGCHSGAETDEHATIPSLATCMACHETALGTSPEEARLRAFGAAGQEIPWRPVTHVPTHVYFSHRRHVTLAKLECGACHGAMNQLTSPPRKPQIALAMNFCIECHQKKQARTDCNDCHR